MRQQGRLSAAGGSGIMQARWHALGSSSKHEETSTTRLGVAPQGIYPGETTAQVHAETRASVHSSRECDTQRPETGVAVAHPPTATLLGNREGNRVNQPQRNCAGGRSHRTEPHFYDALENEKNLQ